jgi:hypothetical protein
MSQLNQILSQLKKGEPLTALDALKKFGCFRLASRVYDLECAGWDIARQTIAVGDKRVTQYLSARRAKKNG